MKKSKWGAREGTQRYIIDEMLIEGGCTMNDIIVACNSSEARVRSHMETRSKEFKVVFIRSEGGKYYCKENDLSTKDKKTKKIIKEFDFE